MKQNNQLIPSEAIGMPIRPIKVRCPECKGVGYTIEGDCCGNLTVEYGCCGQPEPFQKKCKRCDGESIIYVKSL